MFKTTFIIDKILYQVYHLLPILRIKIISKTKFIKIKAKVFTLITIKTKIKFRYHLTEEHAMKILLNNNNKTITNITINTSNKMFNNNKLILYYKKINNFKD